MTVRDFKIKCPMCSGYIVIDARNGKVAIRGWLEQTDKDAVELALEMKSLGVKRIVYTDVMRDGELAGPNIEAVLRLAERTGMGLIASGGFSELQHFRDLADAKNPSKKRERRTGSVFSIRPTRPPR